MNTASRPTPVRKLGYSMMTSLDGRINDAAGSLDWVRIDEELHTHANELTRAAGALLYGRRLWETMAAYWPHGDEDPSEPEVIHEFARIWKAKPKIVYSSSLDAAPGSTLVRHEDALDHIAALKAEPGGPLDIGGAELAASAIRAGLVDEIGQWVMPVVLGGGTPMLPDDLPRVELRLTEERRFGSGVVYLRYAVDREA